MNWMEWGDKRRGWGGKREKWQREAGRRSWSCWEGSTILMFHLEALVPFTLMPI